mmetsp:Transcript_8585/g.20059  ORF Transcript_8585/g.20059 Transcript_8585/m.20059 type:complete len:297 (-) Transcript_8585:482-1372(-)
MDDTEPPSIWGSSYSRDSHTNKYDTKLDTSPHTPPISEWAAVPPSHRRTPRLAHAPSRRGRGDCSEVSRQAQEGLNGRALDELEDVVKRNLLFLRRHVERLRHQLQPLRARAVQLLRRLVLRQCLDPLALCLRPLEHKRGLVADVCNLLGRPGPYECRLLGILLRQVLFRLNPCLGLNLDQVGLRLGRVAHDARVVLDLLHPKLRRAADDGRLLQRLLRLVGLDLHGCREHALHKRRWELDLPQLQCFAVSVCRLERRVDPELEGVLDGPPALDKLVRGEARGDVLDGRRRKVAHK